MNTLRITATLILAVACLLPGCSGTFTAIEEDQTGPNTTAPSSDHEDPNPEAIP